MKLNDIRHLYHGNMTETAADEKAQIIQALLDIAGFAQATMAATLQDFDAPTSAAPALRILATSQAPVTPRDLARLLERDPSTASLIADKLEQIGLVARQPHPSDGRKRVLVLTERGHRLWDTLRERLHESAILDDMTPAERQGLLDLLGRMRAKGRP
ncbi:MarR family winged helix-turn-helix transcriptional regulator [Microbacterium album]|nr:MarR family transcriptional regulator [Microbacterium album]